jgi:hypothetical protein
MFHGSHKEPTREGHFFLTIQGRDITTFHPAKLQDFGKHKINDVCLAIDDEKACPEKNMCCSAGIKE